MASDLLTPLLTLAAPSPSNSNTQPCRVHGLTNDGKRRLAAAIVQESETNGRVAKTEYPYHPAEWPEPFLSRRRTFGQSLYLNRLGIDPADAAARYAHIRNHELSGAPVRLILPVSPRSQGRPFDRAVLPAGRAHLLRR